ncbi:MAG: PKD domain-containing protein, partial [Candidatus Omnitrophica bacterium]|nr:PKD domain-containing protein [Candidatus Omnitrophota bacterium]
NQVLAQWYDLRNGTYSDIGEYNTGGNRQFTAPGSGKENDYVLVLIGSDTSPSNPDPILTITPSASEYPVDFGEVEVGQSTTLPDAFTITNTGEGTLTGTVSEISSQYTIVSGSSFSLADGESQAVGIRFHPQSEGTKTRDITFTSNAGDTTRSVTGIGVETLENQPPVASFTASPTSGEAPLTVNFDARGSYDPDGQIASYNWNFGDGATSQEQNPIHIYQRPGKYEATLKVTDFNNGQAMDSARIIVEEEDRGYAGRRLLKVTPYRGEAPLTVNFTIRGRGIRRIIKTCPMTLYFGDNTSPVSCKIGDNIPHTYETPGKYKAILKLKLRFFKKGLIVGRAVVRVD